MKKVMLREVILILGRAHARCCQHSCVRAARGLITMTACHSVQMFERILFSYRILCFF